MPSDNLERYVKEKLEAVQHTPPPGSTWNPEAAWLKLQPPPVLPRPKKRNWFSYAAAVVILALLAGLMRLYFVSKQPNTEITAATAPATEILIRSNPTDITAEKSAKHQAGNITPEVKSGEPQPKIALGKKNQRSVKSLSLPVAIAKTEQTLFAVSVPDAPPTKTAAGREAIAVSEAIALTETTPQPLKITVVLGKNSMAKLLDQTADNVPAKSRKKRLRLNVPVPEPMDKGHLVLTDSAYQPLKLQARIDL